MHMPACMRRMCCAALACVHELLTRGLLCAGGKSLVADVLMLSRLHETQQALLAKAGPQKNRKPQQQPVTRALIVLPYLSIGACWPNFFREFRRVGGRGLGRGFVGASTVP